MGSIIVVIVHADACPEVFMRLSRATGPQFAIFHRGTIVEELTGVAQKATIERCIQALIPERTERPHRGFLRHVLQFFSGRSSVHGSRERRSIVHAASTRESRKYHRGALLNSARGSANPFQSAFEHCARLLQRLRPD